MLHRLSGAIASSWGVALVALVALFGLALVPATAPAVSFGFGCVTFNDPVDCAIAEAQVVMDVTDPGGSQVLFTFSNLGPEMSTIARIYFDDGSLSTLAAIINGPGVEFVETFPGPNDLPGGNEAIPPFETTLGFSAGAEPPAPGNGVGIDPGEFVSLLFDLQGGQTVGDVIDDLDTGVLRAGVHVINFESEGSESLVTPEPASALLAALGLLGVVALGRRRLHGGG